MHSRIFAAALAAAFLFFSTGAHPEDEGEAPEIRYEWKINESQVTFGTTQKQREGSLAAAIQQCDDEIAVMCAAAGTYFDDDNKDGVEKNYYKAEEFYQRSCHLDNSTCFYLGRLYRYGRGVRQDFLRAMELFGKSCEAGAPLGCFYLSDMYLQGRGVGTDLTKAYQLSIKACDSFRGNKTACYNLGVFHDRGVGGVRQDREMARDYYEKTCAMGHKIACDMAGKFK